MDSAVNSCVHKLFKAKTLLFFISEMTLALEWWAWGVEGGNKYYNNKKCVLLQGVPGTVSRNGSGDHAKYP